MKNCYGGHQPDSRTLAQSLVFLYWAPFCGPPSPDHFPPLSPTAFPPGTPSAFFPPLPSSPESQSLLGLLCLASSCLEEFLA